MFGKKVVNLSTSKSPPDLATISVGRIIIVCAAGSKNSYTSINSLELSPCTGILTASRVIDFLLSPLPSHSSFLIIWFNLCLVPIASPSLCFKFKRLLKFPCKAIATFIGNVLPSGPTV